MPFDAYQPTKQSTKDAAVLRTARALIDGGWLKGAYYHHHKGQRQYCAVAAITTALGLETLGRGPLPIHADYLARELLREFPRVRLAFTTKGRLMRINDSRGTTKAKMLEGFDRAIARLEAA